MLDPMYVEVTTYGSIIIIIIVAQVQLSGLLLLQSDAVYECHAYECHASL